MMISQVLLGWSKVNWGLDLDAMAENRVNLGRAIPWTHLFIEKPGAVGLWILGVDI